MAADTGGEATAQGETGTINSIDSGSLIESLQIGLNSVLGLERKIAVLEAGRQMLIDGVVDLEEAEWALGETAHIMSDEGPGEDDKPQALSEFLHMMAGTREQNADMYAPAALKKVGLLSVLIGSETKLVDQARQSWSDGPLAREWLGKTVILRRPSVDAIREDPNVPNTGPSSRLLENGKPVTPYYPGGDIARQQGKLEEVSPKQNGRLVLSRGDEAIEVIDLFEAVKDPETGLITHYLPRVAIETLSLADRAKHSARRAAVRRLGPDLPELL